MTPAVRPLPPRAELPIRAEYFQDEKMRRLGIALAQDKVPDFPGLGEGDFQARQKENAREILRVYEATGAAQANGHAITPAAQWLLDNNYLVEESIVQVRRDLPRRFYEELPTVTLANGSRVPRALLIVWAYVAHTDSTISPESLRVLVEAYQEVQPLKIGEIWALPSFLRFVLIENLRRLSLRVDRARLMRVIANETADRLQAGDEAAQAALLGEYTDHARDASFATQLLYRLRDGSRGAGAALTWLERELEKHGTDAEEIIRTEHRTLASGNVTTGNIIRGLRLANDVEWNEWFESVSLVDNLLRGTSNFGQLDFQSRDEYRSQIEKLARNSPLGEDEVARRAIALSQASGSGDVGAGLEAASSDIGYFLVGSRRPELEADIGYRPGLSERAMKVFRSGGWLSMAIPSTLLVIGFLLIASVVTHAAGLSAGWTVLLLVLFAFPAMEGAIGLFNTLMLLFMTPTRLIGYDYREGVPAEARTLVVVPTLLGSRAEVEEMVQRIEVHHLANMHGELYFALLSDWPDATSEQTEADVEILAYARAQIAILNHRYPAGVALRFHLLHRRRLFNAAEGVWMGWERKRGKLHELNLLLRGDADTTFLPLDTPLPPGIVHVMTLDADTRMMRDAASKMVGKLAHPLNRPVIDAGNGRIERGYSILQPRVTASLTTGEEASFFQRVFSAGRGLDPYVFAVSDLYQDMFGQGTFTGKGLYHVDAMEAVLKGRIPENTVLSHDLLEGALAHAALVTDVEVVEDYPTQYSVDASRQHRWARGDWQLLPFIFDMHSGIGGLSRWKMVDNLRRTLTPIFWIAAATAAWSLMPFSLASQWVALLVLSLFVAPTFDLIHALTPKSIENTLRGHVAAFGREFFHASAQVALKVVLIAHTATMMIDAIVRTLYRLVISRKNMLEWRTASQVQRSQTGTLAYYYNLMKGAPLVAAGTFILSLIGGTTGVWLALIYAVLWGASPAIAWFVSQSAEVDDQLVVTASDRQKLRRIARRTWLYFETFVDDEHNQLPPDNFQETPNPVEASRTSPTNIGMYLLSVIAARDFGWVSLNDAIHRVSATLDTVDRLDKDRGHLYNWYDTKTLYPLHPRYISSVDSGNFAGHLIAIARAFEEWAEAPAAYLQGDMEGVLDTVGVLETMLAGLPDDRRQTRPVRHRLDERIVGMRRAVESIRSEPETAAIRTLNLAVNAGELSKLARAIHEETASTASALVVTWAEKVQQVCEAHISDSHFEEERLAELRARMQELSRRARTIAFKMEFSFLLRQDRKLLSIGYRVEDRQLDESCYDLLASEARLTSLFAIAKGDVPTEHWFKLGRPIVEIGYRGALISWSGSMFEYLMPPLVMKEPVGGILNQTCRLVIKKQISYGKSKGIPWGISEAAYNARDREMTYQYTNFGVPGLGLKRGLANNAVIAPYATVLAAQFAPAESVDNLDHLASVGALGQYGFYDAVDFTPTRVPAGQTSAVVRNFYAHHQGMSIVAIGNVVHEGRMRDRFHRDPVIESAELLLQEKAPRDIPVATVRSEAPERAKEDAAEISPDIRHIINPLDAPKATGLLSNGVYSIMLSSNGAGYSRFGEQAVTRWQPDPVEDRLGSFLFLRDVSTGDWWSATADPKRAPGETAEVVFADDKATFVKTVGTLRSEVECIVVAEANGEARRLTIHNQGPDERVIEVTSFAELALASEASDNAHPAFSKMFVKTEIDKSRGLIFAERRKRAASDKGIAAAHFVTAAATHSADMEAETDRRAFLGRGRDLRWPAAFDAGAELGGGDGFVLDPIFSLRRKVRIPAHKKLSLTFWTVVGESRDEVSAMIGQLDHPESFARQSMHSWTGSQVQCRHVGFSLAEAADVQRLGRYLLYPHPAMRAAPDTIAAGMGPQSALWPMSISGDYPIFALRIADIADIDIVARALRMQEYLRFRGMMADLVIVNEQASSYVQDLQNAIESLAENSRLRGRELGPRQHIFAVRRDLMDDRSYQTLIASARIVMHTRNGKIEDQIERAELESLAQLALVGSETGAVSRSPSPKLETVQADGEGLEFWNGFGGFADDGRTYVVRLGAGEATPQPWINIISNGNFGFHVSSEGSAFTWSRNSRDFQLTPWSNDPVTNRPGETIFVRDIDTGEVFSPFAGQALDSGARHEARHGQGVSRFEGRLGTLTVSAEMVVDPVDPVKVTRISIDNAGNAPRRLRVYTSAEWVLGNNRGRSAPMFVPSVDEATGALLVKNPYGLDFGDRVAFLASNRPMQSYTADRAEFIGGSGSSTLPGAVSAGATLSGRVEAGRDICAAAAFDIELAANAEDDMLLMIGDAGSADEASTLVRTHAGRPFETRLRDNDAAWKDFLGTLQVETPDRSLNTMVNTWLPYQALACRIRARAGFYQASGAFGFRDQLQDTMALLSHDPELARAQIINAASRQFPEGDVQHWWLPRTGAGVRTMISDDVVWLGHCVAYFIKVMGDDSILEHQLPFILGDALKEGVHDAFYTPEISREKATIYEHAARALDLAIKRTAETGIPLILGGDWNDGMNRVGEGGRGDSVWLGWFLLRTLREFAPIARSKGDAARADAWLAHADSLKAALEASGWDGDWYRRGSFDDGTPLGSKSSDECRIDSIAQSWSVLSGFGDKDKSAHAMASAKEALVDEDHDLIRLFTPPFDKTEKEPGYIKAYPPGVRENGGQYTHAAAWFVLAMAELGQGDDALAGFRKINPINHSLDRDAAEKYRVEPYVVAADIYSEGALAGRGGWTWYTGSAGWLYRAAVEGILGISREGDTLKVKPALPSDWNGFAASLKIDGRMVRIAVERSSGKGTKLTVNGKATDQIKLSGEGDLDVKVGV
ncbi:MAG: glucoamylase family protein [Mesorhizobium sp.]